MIKILLIGSFLYLCFRIVFSQRRQIVGAMSKAMFLAGTVVAIVAIIYPDSVTAVAQSLGVGRGADLLLYGTLIMFLVHAMSGYLEKKRSAHREGCLIRELAMISKELELLRAIRLKND